MMQDLEEKAAGALIRLSNVKLSSLVAPKETKMPRKLSHELSQELNHDHFGNGVSAHHEGSGVMSDVYPSGGGVGADTGAGLRFKELGRSDDHGRGDDVL